MPTLPLYLPCDPNTQTDSWRQVRIPGGFECWRFYAQAAADTGIDFYFSLGLNGGKAYRKQYRQWQRRPTRNAPPVSMDRPGIGLHLWNSGRPIHRHWFFVDADEFRADSDGRTLHIGRSVLAFDGNIGAGLILDHPQLSGRALLEVTEECSMESLPQYGVFTVAHRRYTASITLASPTGQFGPIQFTGRADYEHCFGNFVGSAVLCGPSPLRQTQRSAEYCGPTGCHDAP